MKRLIILIFLLLLLTGCTKNNHDDKIYDNANIFTTPDVASDPEPSIEPTIVINHVKEQKYPIFEDEITDQLTTYMYESFGGSGNESFATSWYKYIDYYEVYQNEDFYYGVLHLKERPFDASARLLLNEYYTDDELDFICPILIDVGASLNLDDIDLCLIGENLYKIETSNDVEIYYYSLVSLGIPVYDFLSEGFGQSIDDVKSAIRKNQIPGTQASECIVDYMEYSYSDSFDGLSMEMVNNLSLAVLSNFNDVSLETLSVVDQDNQPIHTYKLD